jgi:hypothetical protein
MYEWISSFLFTYLEYIVAPILYHTSCDGYVMTFIFTIMELSDTFAGYKIYFTLIFVGLLKRNYLFSLFKNTSILSNWQSSSKHLHPSTNRLKLLGADSINNLKKLLTPVVKSVKSRFFN